MINDISPAVYDNDPYFVAPLTAEERKVLVGERLKELRTEYGLTQKDVCELIGTTAQTYSGYEKGKYEPSCETLVRFARLFNTSLDYILGKNFDRFDERSELRDEIETYDPDNARSVQERLLQIELAVKRFQEILEEQKEVK